MPGGQTKFGQSWLDQIDCNGHTLRWWCRADIKDVYAGFCILCFKKLPCANIGLRQMLKHATGVKHKEIACVRFSQKEKHLVVVGLEGASAWSIKK